MGVVIHYVLAVQRVGFSVETFRCMALSGILLGLSVVNLACYVIPDGFIASGILLWLLTIPFSPYPWMEETVQGLCSGFLIAGVMLGVHCCSKSSPGRRVLAAVIMKKSKIPFGPSISIAACISMLYGSILAQWYLNLFF